MAWSPWSRSAWKDKDMVGGAVHARGAEAAGQRRPGRPRSERADEAIIDAALSLFAESGPEGLCMERVAARAGVGKATIYRRWHSKEDLLLDAIAALKAPLPAPAGVSVRDDLVRLVSAMCQEAADPRRAGEFALLLGEGAQYPRLMARYVETVVKPRRDVVAGVLRRGVARGELRPDIDVDVAVSLLTGAALALGRHVQDDVPEDYAGRVVAEFLRGLAAR